MTNPWECEDFDGYAAWLREIGCRFQGECCMGHTDHFRHECYTAEMAEAEEEHYRAMHKEEKR